ncbi:MAG: serine/threonine-protein kinase [Planctomycetota bacterium]
MNAKTNQQSSTNDSPWGDADFWVKVFVSEANLSQTDADHIANDWINAGRPSGFLGLYAAEKGFVAPVFVKTVVERLLRSQQTSEITQSQPQTSPVESKPPAPSALTPADNNVPQNALDTENKNNDERAKVLRPPSVRQPKVVKTKRPSIFSRSPSAAKRGEDIDALTEPVVPTPGPNHSLSVETPVASDSPPMVEPALSSEPEISDEVTLSVGAKLGPILLTQLIGSGGAAIVYRGFHLERNEPVAVKIFQPRIIGDDHDVSRKKMGFKREAEILAQLQHENIIRIYDYYEKAGRLVTVLEYIDGLALDEVLNYIGRISPPSVARIMREVCDALSYALSLGMLHRDIKPANLLLGRDGRVRVSDFGLAGAWSPIVPFSPSGVRSSSGAIGQIAGTPIYMSPEQTYPGGRLDHRSDIYSLGQTAFHLLTGQTAFTGDDASGFIRKHRSATPPPIRSMMPELPERFAALIDSMMEKEPDRRPYDYMDIVEKLQGF